MKKLTNKKMVKASLVGFNGTRTGKKMVDVDSFANEWIRKKSAKDPAAVEIYLAYEEECRSLISDMVDRRMGRRTINGKIYLPGDFVDYQEYLRSEAWNARKKKIYKDPKKRKCQVCDSKIGLQLHHKKYRDHEGESILFEEKPSNLVTLCADCHRKFHGK